MKPEAVTDLVPMDDPREENKTEEGSLEEIAGFVSDVLTGAGKGILSGVLTTASDLADGCAKLCQGDVNGAAEILKDRADAVITGTAGAIESGIAVTKAGCRAMTDDEPFLTEENKAHLTKVCTLGIYAAAAAAGIDAVDGTDK